MGIRSGSGNGRSGIRRRVRLQAVFGCALALALACTALPSVASAFEPIVQGVSATPTGDGANLNGTIYPYGQATTYRYEYGTTTSYGTNVPVPDGSAGSAAYPSTVQVPETISGLPAGQTYHFRLVATNPDGTARSADQTFTTAGPKPIVSSQAATQTAGGFMLTGSVNPNGSATEYRFEYGTSTSYGTKVPIPDGSAGSGSTAVSVSEEVTGLLPNTTYHFRLTAHSATGTTSTADRSFTTPPSPPAAPTAVVEAPTATANGYMLRGAVNPNHLDTTYHFEFGPTTAYGLNLPATDADVGSGENAVPVSAEATNLAPSTVYHYRIVADNSEGTSNSPDQTFTTAPEPPAVASLPATPISGGFALNATVNPHGASTTYRFDFGVTTAYGTSIPSAELNAGSGSSPVSVSVPVTGLPPNTPYHFRVVAQNGGGTSVGEDEFFMTPAPASELSTPPALPKPPAPAPATPAAPVETDGGGRLLRVSSATAHGSVAKLRITVSGPGRVTATGKLIKKAGARSSGAGVVVLRIKLSARGRRKLAARHGRALHVPAKVLFAPVGGSPTTMRSRLTFKKH